MMKDKAVLETYITPEEHVALLQSKIANGQPDYDMEFKSSNL